MEASTDGVYGVGGESDGGESLPIQQLEAPCEPLREFLKDHQTRLDLIGSYIFTVMATLLGVVGFGMEASNDGVDGGGGESDGGEPLPIQLPAAACKPLREFCKDHQMRLDFKNMNDVFRVTKNPLWTQLSMAVAELGKMGVAVRLFDEVTE